ncbi:hypothetical protein JOC77_000873 [Peribacillus deserti]|uniref:Uncharacterized protein n=1 Tax=Peribacillus deserti TaxID=673318 RepID=A0ABS2QEA7_9BACI|nr:hypothetical protein [Peribacillus deserti]
MRMLGLINPYTRIKHLAVSLLPAFFLAFGEKFEAAILSLERFKRMFENLRGKFEI